MTVHGIDVSSYQSETYSLTGVDFVFVKATEGTAYTNPKMKTQAARARAAGRVVGFYHFVRPGDMAAQARYFAAQAASGEGDPLWLDWEDPGVSCAEKDRFLSELKQLRGGTHRIGLYCSADYWLHRDTTSRCGDALWIAHYGVPAGKPGIKAPWLFHQYTSTPLDKNVGNFSDRAALKAWASKATPRPAPAKPAIPTVDLSNVAAAARKDPAARQGHTTHAADVRRVEAALKAEGLLSATYASDGSYGTTTVAAYRKWQKRCGYSGRDADGIPGRESLTRLGKKHGFKVVA
jgi:Glycosyl hydrolases family 25